MSGQQGAGSQVAPLKQDPPLRDRVYTALEELIISGVLAPGQRLVETELAAQLGVSRNPIREAMQALAQAGWVDLRSRQGAQVHTPTADEVRQFFEWRAVVEVETARLAARNVGGGDMAALQALLEEGEHALVAGDEEGVTLANTTFHDRVARMTRNHFFVSSLETVNRRLRWYFRPVAIARGRRSWDEHAELIAALIAGDEDRAAEVTRQHTDATRQAYLRHHRMSAPSA